MPTEMEMMQEQFSILFRHVINIDYDDNNLLITFSFLDIRNALPKCETLFDKNNNINIDGREYEPVFNELPTDGDRVTILTSSAILNKAQIFSANDFATSTRKYVKWLATDSERANLSGWKFLIGQEYINEMPQVFIDAQECFSVYKKLSKLADHKFSGTMAFLCSKTILEVPSKFNEKCVYKLDNASEFLNTNYDNSTPEGNIFKSVLYDNLSKVDKKDRLEKFFSRFDIIIQEFKVSCSIHYDKYNLNQLKKNLDESFISLNDKIKNSVENVKGELILIVSMAFALSQFDLEWSGSIVKNIIIFASLLLASVIYSFLIHFDKKSLLNLGKIVDAENERLNEILVEERFESEKTKMISEDVKLLKENIDSHSRFLTFCLFSIWLPLLILIIGIVIIYFTGLLDTNSTCSLLTHNIAL
ncbi:hypothetical protein [Pleomorphochaeta sp. DL1XJH-081]|uniref:hypothetical protein n=1 Tax=Pleomorphochaeta sp. DL1XJH-081 TaxID=3409690 RepID=UPI003BB6E934